jgi:hypothetical protein
MLQKLKVTSYALIYFLMVGFSFIALQVTTEEVEAAPGVCEPVEHIKAMKGGSRNHDYILWVDRCQVTGSKGQCGHKPEWPFGDGGRCAMSSADTVATSDVNPNAVPEMTAAVKDASGVCEPIERIKAMKGGSRNHDYTLWVNICKVSGSNGTCGNSAERPVGDGGRCEMPTAGTVAAQDVDHEAEAARLAAEATVAAQDNMGVCEPVERIKAMKGDLLKRWDYTEWVDKCQISGSEGTCGNTREWPDGDGGRCEKLTATTYDNMQIYEDEERAKYCAGLRAGRRVQDGRSGPIGTYTYGGEWEEKGCERGAHGWWHHGRMSRW